MSELKTEYRGYSLDYGDNSDEWSCRDLNLSNASLAKLKEKIDKVLLDERKAASYMCLDFSGIGRGMRSEEKLSTRILEYLGPKYERQSYDYKNNRQPEPKLVGHKIARMVYRANDRPVRNETFLENLMDDTPENHALFDQAVAMYAEAEKIAKRAKAIADSIPRVSIDKIAGLVDIYNREHGIVRERKRP